MFEPGTQVGRYEIQRRLGRGGMGTVYVAHDPVLGRMVAIKLFAGELDMPDARERFSREARAAAALNHPNIVTVYDFGELEAQPYIVMEYVPGETLAGVIRRKTPMSTADKLRWIEELCAGAGYAHQMSVVHRDIKPANLMLDRAGRLKILDFGIARMLGIASNTAMMIGTPGYMAPEQITGGTVDHRSDQFSIGVVFYELLAYTEAFPGDTLPMITHRILTEEPVPLDRLVPDVSPDVIAIVGRALKKNIAERFKDADAMRMAIGRVRRQFESDADWNAATMPAGRDSTPPPGGRGTGSSKRRSTDAVGVAQLTPPPDPRRTDREALARRRATQLEAALQEARRLFEQQQLVAALDACYQALTFDENHAGALELEQEIETALKIHEGTETVADSAKTMASEPSVSPSLAGGRLLESQAITRLGEEAIEIGGLPSGLHEPVVAPNVRPPAPPMVSEETAIRLPAALADATIVARGRRTPSIPPQAGRPATSPPVAKTSAATGSVAAKSAVSPAKEKSAAPVRKVPGVDVAALWSSIAPALRRVGPAVRPAVEAVRGVVTTTIPPGKATIVWASAGVAVLAAVVVGVFMMTRGPVPTGTLVIDAVPWASITAIENESGTQQPLPSPASTPVSLALPAGTYQITLTGPLPDLRTERVSVRVDVGGTSIVPVTRFQAVTAEEYFEQYLGSPAAGSDTSAAAEPVASSAATASTPAVAAPAGANP
jgi:hypothetical protein